MVSDDDYERLWLNLDFILEGKVSLNGELMHICVLRDLLMCYPTDTYSHVNIAWQTAVVQLSLCVSSSIWYSVRYVLRMQENDLLQNPLIP